MTLCITHPIKSVTAEGESKSLVFSASFTESLSQEDVQQCSTDLTWKLATPNIWKATTSLISATSDDKIPLTTENMRTSKAHPKRGGVYSNCAETILVMLYLAIDFFSF